VTTAPHSGRPQTVRANRRAEILAVTLTPPEHLGVTHWSTRLLADELGVSHNTVARVWRDYDVDEKSQIQALDRTAPNLPPRPGSPERRTHDYVRHGTTTLFAAVEVATGRVTDQCFDRHRHAEFLAFLKLVAKAYPRQLHLVLDNYGTHTHPTVKTWLVKHRASTCTSPQPRRVG
jgi:hypothetical protein